MDLGILNEEKCIFTSKNVFHKRFGIRVNDSCGLRLKTESLGSRLGLSSSLCGVVVDFGLLVWMSSVLDYICF